MLWDSSIEINRALVNLVRESSAASVPASCSLVSECELTYNYTEFIIFLNDLNIFMLLNFIYSDYNHMNLSLEFTYNDSRKHLYNFSNFHFFGFSIYFWWEMEILKTMQWLWIWVNHELTICSRSLKTQKRASRRQNSNRPKRPTVLMCVD